MTLPLQCAEAQNTDYDRLEVVGAVLGGKSELERCFILCLV